MTSTKTRIASADAAEWKEHSIILKNHLVRLTDDLNLIDENQKLEDQKEMKTGGTIIRWASQQYQKNQISKSNKTYESSKARRISKTGCQAKKERKAEKRQRWKEGSGVSSEKYLPTCPVQRPVNTVVFNLVQGNDAARGKKKQKGNLA